MITRRRPTVLTLAVTALLVALLQVPAGGEPRMAIASDPEATSLWPCPHWGMYGANLERTFSREDCESGISPTTVATLLPAWTFPTFSTVTASPAVVGGMLYVGDWTPRMYGLDATSGDVVWTYDPEPAPHAAFGPIVSSPAVTDVIVDGEMRRLVIFGAGPHLYALDAFDGSEVWVKYVGAFVEGERTQIESSPAVWEGVVYVGKDTHNRPEDQTGGVKGGILAVDAATGERLWKFEPELDDPGHGCGGVWSSPAIDTEASRVYFGGANCPTEYEWTPYIEALVALDARTGDPLWSFQPEPQNRDDTDFGATPNLFTDASGRRVVGGGKKNAVYYALDPDSGELLWETQVAEPGNFGEDFAIGGFLGSPAVWEGRVFGTTAIGGPLYMHALDGETGAIAWQGVAAPSYAASAVVNGVVLVGDLSGTLKAFDAETGALLWLFPLLGPISSGVAVVGDWIFVGAGTSSSDACIAGEPFESLCLALFEEVLGSVGGIHAFHLPLAEDPPAAPLREVTTPTDAPDPDPAPADEEPAEDLPATGASGGIVVALIGLLLAAWASRLRGGYAPR